MAFVAMGMAAFQLASSYYANENIKDTAALNQEIAEMNAQYAELDAYDAKIQGKTFEAKYQKVVDKTLSDQQAALTAGNIDVNYGSASEIQKETRFIADINRMEINKQAEERALGFTREAGNTRLQSFLNSQEAQTRASDVKSKALIKAGGAAIQGGLSGYGAYKSSEAVTDLQNEEDFMEDYYRM